MKKKDEPIQAIAVMTCSQRSSMAAPFDQIGVKHARPSARADAGVGIDRDESGMELSCGVQTRVGRLPNASFVPDANSRDDHRKEQASRWDVSRRMCSTRSMAGRQPGVTLTLDRLAPDGSRKRVAQSHDQCRWPHRRPAAERRRLQPGTYELTFAIGAYFRGLGTVLPAPPSSTIVPIRFGIADAEGHYHVPLLASPWSYSTYRGS